MLPLDILKLHIKEGQKVVLGLSGGPDSVYLFHLLREFQKERPFVFQCAHIHHGLREEAEEDMKFVMDLCQEYQVDLRVEKWDVKAYGKEKKLSTEEAGREIRYRLFYSLAGEEGLIVLGHHKDDQVETVLMRILRGTGLEGLGGMKIYEEQKLRPLLGIYKKEILETLDKKKIPYCLDHTNEESIYQRNKIRLEWIPRLLEENPNGKDALAELARQSLEAENYLDKVSEEKFSIFGKKIGEEWAFPIEELLLEDPAIRSRLIRKAIYKTAGNLQNISSQHIKDVEDLLLGSTGKEIHLPQNIFVRKSYNKIFFSLGQGKKDFEEIRIEENKEYHGGRFHFQRKNFNKEETYLGPHILLGSGEVKIRPRRPGDKIRIFSGHKKVKDLFIDKKVDRNLRELWPLVEYEGEIVWIPYLYTHPFIDEFYDDTPAFVLELREEL